MEDSTRNRRKNREVLIYWMLIVSATNVLFAMDYMSGGISVDKLIGVMISGWVPFFICYILNFIVGQDNLKIRYGILIGYMCFYTYLVMGTGILLAAVFVFPIAILLMAYNDSSLSIITYSIAIIANLVNALTKGYENMLEVKNIDWLIFLECIVLMMYFTPRIFKLLGSVNISLYEKEYKDITADTITNSRNRYFLTDFIESNFKDINGNAKKANITLAVIDIDKFKEINELYGYRFGDLVLKKLSDILSRNIEDCSNTHLIRLSADQFIIISAKLRRLDLESILLSVEEQIKDAGIAYGDKIVNFTISKGIANSMEDNTFTYNELYIEADTRLFQAKVDLKEVEG